VSILLAMLGAAAPGRRSRAAARSQLRREGLIAPQAITAFVVGLGAIPQAS